MRIFYPYKDALSKVRDIALRLRRLHLDIGLAHLPMAPGAYNLGLSFQVEPDAGSYLSICLSVPFLGSLFLTVESVDILMDPEARRIFDAASSPGIAVRDSLTPYGCVSDRCQDRLFRSRGVHQIYAWVRDRGTHGDSGLADYTPVLWDVVPESGYATLQENRDICTVIHVSFEEFRRLDI